MPAYIREADEESMLAMAIVENIQRQDLNAIEVALSLQRLVDECHLTQDSLGERVGKKRSTVANYLRLLKLPVEVQLAVREELISMGHARALINLESEQQQIALLKKTIKKGLSVRQVEEAVKELNSAKPRKAEADEEFPESYSRLVEHLERLFTQEISIKKNNKGGGKIVIGFGSDDDIETFIGKMVSRNRNIFLWGAVCARTAAFLLASVLVWTHARAQAPEERYKIVNGVRTRIVVSDSASTAKADTVAITQQSLSPVELDTTTTARQRRQLARMARDTSSVRYSKLFRDTMPISRVCWISAVAPGFGQLYNKQAWKIPILYGTVATTAYFGFRENSKFRDYKRQYDALRRDNAPQEDVDPIQSEMIRHNTGRTLLWIARSPPISTSSAMPR